MKTLVIVGRTQLPGRLRDLLERGSTSVVEKRASDVSASEPPADADRVVLWAAPGDDTVAKLAGTYSRGASPERKDTLIIICPESAGAVSGVQASEVFVWPRDEDRLKLAFLTGG
jgi:hypothetical protein